MLTAFLAALGAALVLSAAPALPLPSSSAGVADPVGGPRGPHGPHHWGWTGAGACPHYCTCYLWPPGPPGLRRVDCVDRRLVGVNLGLPADTEVADLSENIISNLDAGCFQKLGLVQLRELTLGHNAIRDVHPWAFSGLRLLRYLDLSDNHLEALHPNTFAANRGLKTLLLAGNNLARVPSDVPLLAAPRLQVLDLSDCKLAHLGSSFFADLPALASLNLSANYLIQLHPKAVANQRQLQMLDLTRNPLACDVNTRQMLQQLQAANMTVRHSCPPAGTVGQQQTSKHLLRVMADVQHASAAAGAEPEAPGLHGVYGGVGEEHGMLMEGWGVGGEGPSPHQTHESMAVAPGLPLESESDYFEEDSADSSDAPSGHGSGIGAAGAAGAAGAGAPNANRGCSPLFPDRNTRNPVIFKDWFDPVPSFWAAVFGGWIGFVMGLVLSSCACHQALWRALCFGSKPALTPLGRHRHRNRRLPHPRTRTRARARTRLSLEIAYAEAEAEAQGLALCASSSTAGLASVAPDQGPPWPTCNSLDALELERPETPPPAYHELVRAGFCQP